MKHAHVRVQVVAEADGRDPREAYAMWDNEPSGYDLEDYQAQLDDPVCAEHGELLPCQSGCQTDRPSTIDLWSAP